MPRGRWLREEQADLAIEKILDAAGEAFVTLGVSRAGMSDIARLAGCSRGTLYRYFDNRHELHLAFVNRAASEIGRRVADAVRDIDDPGERLVESILRSLREVRETPAAAAWFHRGDSGMAAAVSQHPEVIDSLAGAFARGLLDPREGTGRPTASNSLDGQAEPLRTVWLIRVIVSLLTMPGANEDEEREMVTRFVAPGLLADAGVA